MTDEPAAEVLALIDELGVVGRPRAEMLADPERALPALRRAKYSLGIQNPAAYATTRFRRAGAEPPSAREGPPTLATLELAWSLPPSPAVSALLTLLAAAVSRYGFADVAAALDQTRI